MTRIETLASTDSPAPHRPLRRHDPRPKPLPLWTTLLDVDESKSTTKPKARGSPCYCCMADSGASRTSPHKRPSSKRYRVFAFERPGHGHTADLPGPFSYSAMAQQTVDFMETMNLGASGIVGWSDGAIVALLVAISRPDLVKNLVSVSGTSTRRASPPKPDAGLRL
jgi:hypothetical protein